MKNILDIEIVKMAYVFAKKAHGEQRRKYTNELYIVHPLSVANIVADVVKDDVNIISASLLHDVVEDTSVTIKKIRDIFGDDISKLVLEVTDISKPEDGNRKIRKQKDLEHIALASSRGKTIKLADLIDNWKSIHRHDPKFAVVYKREAIALLEVLKEGDSTLYNRLKNNLK